MNSLVSIVIPTFNRITQLSQLLDSLVFINEYKNIEIIIVDNNSLDLNYEQLLSKYLAVNILIKKIINYTPAALSRSRNMGVKESKGEYIFFIDDDNVIEKDTISKLLQTITANPSIGIISPAASYDNNKDIVLDAGAERNYLNSFTVNLFLNEPKTNLPKSFFYVSEISNAFMIKKEVFLRIGLFDEVNFPIDLDEADFCLRAKRAGFNIAIEPKAFIYHKVEKINSLAITSLRFRREKNAYFMGRNRILFQRKHLSRINYIIYFICYFPIFCYLYIFSSLLPQPDSNFLSRIRYIGKFLEGICHGLFYDYNVLNNKPLNI